MGCLAPHYRLDGANSHTGHNHSQGFVFFEERLEMVIRAGFCGDFGLD